MKKEKGSNFILNHLRSRGDSLIPRNRRREVLSRLRTAGIMNVPYLSFGIAYHLFLASSMLISVLLVFFTGLSNIPIPIKVLIAIAITPILYFIISRFVMFLYRLYIDIRVKAKVSEMEEQFPEFLSILAINLRAGNNFAFALENSIDKEYGALSDELSLMVRRIKLGGGVEEAIKDFKTKFESDLINDTFDLILLSWKKGGDTASLVERIHDNIRSARFLNEKIVASVTNYKIFLNLLAFGITPAMFAITYHLIDLVRRITSQIADVPSGSSLPFSINSVQFSDSHFITFSVLSVVLISLCVAFVINIISGGKSKNVFKKLFFYGFGTYIVYRAFLWIFSIFFALFAV